MLTPKNWTTFQHYHDRRPPWIKLHKSLLDDVDYLCLPDASKALAPFLWLLASEYEGGQITLTMPKLAIRLRMSEDKLMEGIKPLIDEGFFVASEALAELEQSARLDREETEKRQSTPLPPKGEPVRATRQRRTRTQILEPFGSVVIRVVNTLLDEWRLEDPKDGRKITASPEDTGKAVDAILKTQPNVTGDMLVQAGRNYLASTRERYKAPQYFFGPEGPWDGFVKAILTAQEVPIAS